MEDSGDNSDIEKEIAERKDEIKMLQKKKKLKKINEARELRIRSNNNGGSNKLIRVSNKFAEKILSINKKRGKKRFEELSGPKITDLIIKHKIGWPKIEEDIIGYNTSLESEFNEEEFSQ